MANKKRYKDYHSFAEPAYLQSQQLAGNIDPDINTPDQVEDKRFEIDSQVPYVGEIVTRSMQGGVWDYYPTQVYLQNPAKILLDVYQNVEAWDNIICDGRVKAAFNNLRSGILSLQYCIDENGAPARVFKFVQKNIDMLPVYDCISAQLMARLYGYAVDEVIWDYAQDENKLIVTNIVSKAQRWFAYDYENNLRYRNKQNMTLGDPVPPRKFLVTRLHPTYEDPYSGREAICNAIYWPVKFRSAILKYSVDFLDKYGTPWIDATYEAQLPTPQKDELLNRLKNSIRHGIILHPDTSEIKPLLTSDSRAIDNYIKFLDYLNKEIDMAILGNNLSTEVKGGSFAAATAHAGIRDDIVQECIRMIETTWNQLIEWICWYNFPHGIEFPKFKLYKNYPPSKEQAEIMVMMAKMGVKFKKEYFQRTLGIPENEFDLGEPVQEMNPGMKGNIVGASGQGDGKEMTTKNNEDIQDKGIEAKDASSNNQTIEK